jgi:signal transduction histidine kinase
MTIGHALTDDTRQLSGSPRWVPTSSAVGQLIASRDWSQSALGPIEGWPATLTEAVAICLDAHFPSAIAWGPRRVQLYNDAFAGFCGNKHPSALGGSMQDCWKSAWPALGPYFERALAGQGSFVGEAPLFLDRSGVLEEAFATYSFSPVRDRDHSTVAGVLLTLVETTSRALSERRTKLLHDVIAAGAGIASPLQALTASVQVLDDATRDVPFALLYGLERGRKTAELLAHTRSAPERCCSSGIELEGDGAFSLTWPLASVAATNQKRMLTDLDARFGTFDCLPYPEPPRSALLLPISLPGATHPCAVLVAAQSPRLPVDEEYVAFFERLAAAVSTNLANAHAHEAQRRHFAERSAHDYAKHLERANQELEAFSYSVSHDLRTPLRAIDGFSKALLAKKLALLDEEGKECVWRLRRAAERMGELIDELLKLSGVSRAPLHRHTISLTKLAEVVAANLRESQPEREVKFQAEPSLTACADPQLLQIVIENLLENSWKFTQRRSDARVCVGQLESADTPTYFVRDNGAGFDPSHAQHLFQPFQRLHLERDYPGTGIGLAIVHRIIARHGGQIWAEGREQQGATFYFTLPEVE